MHGIMLTMNGIMLTNQCLLCKINAFFILRVFTYRFAYVQMKYWGPELQKKKKKTPSPSAVEHFTLTIAEF